MIPTDLRLEPGPPYTASNTCFVYTRNRWSDDWSLADRSNWWPESITWCCGPTIPTAQMRYVYGRCYRGISTWNQWNTYAKAQLRGPVFVRLHYSPDLQVTGDFDSRYWYGVIEDVGDQHEGIQEVVTGAGKGGEPITTKLPFGQQTFLAYGLEQLLARHVIRDSRFYRGSGAETTDERLTFNFRGKPNRTTTSFSGTSIFHYKPGAADAAYWSTREIVRYLLRWQTPRDSLNARQLTFESLDLSVLPSWDAPVIEQDGATTLQLIHRLISRQRLYTHWWEVAEGPPDTVRLRIDTLTPNDVPLAAVPGSIVPAATRQIRLICDEDDQTSVSIKDSEVQVYDVVYARGAPELSVGTFSWEDATLQAGWTAAEEDRYEYGASQTAAYLNVGLAEQQKMNVAARSDPRLDDVYSRFVIKPDWDQKVGNGLGGAQSNMFPGQFGPVPVYFPTCFVQPGLPLYPGVDYSADAIATGNAVAGEPARADDVERRPVLCCFRKPAADADGEQRWFRAEDIGRLARLEGIDPEDAERISVHVSIPAHSHSVQLRVSTGHQHAIAASQFAPLDEDEESPDWDFADGCVITLALPNGRRATGRFPLQDPAGTDFVRVLEVDAGGRYERIYVAPETVVGIGADGQLVRSQGGWIERPANCQTILGDIAKIAAAWYTIPHRVLIVETTRLIGPAVLDLGDLIQSCGDPAIPNNTHDTVVNASVSEIRLTWPTTEGDSPPPCPTLTITTFAGELDAVAIGPGAIEGAGNPFKPRRIIKL